MAAAAAVAAAAAANAAAAAAQLPRGCGRRSYLFQSAINCGAAMVMAVAVAEAVVTSVVLTACDLAAIPNSF